MWICLRKVHRKVLQSLLVSQNASELRGVPLAETATVDGKDYQFYLRFQRSYQPYSVKLIDVSRTNYIGTSTPRDYRSVIRISEPGSDETEEFSVWMNNPLRFKGETFYQTGHQDLGGGREMTTLSVVNNQGWMLPYIACMIAMFGMFAQFGQTLFRFLDRTGRSWFRTGHGPVERDLHRTCDRALVRHDRKHQPVASCSIRTWWKINAVYAEVRYSDRS